MSLLLTILRIAEYPSFDLVSPLPRDECIRRLRDNIEPFSWKIYSGGVKIYDGSANAGPKPFTGRIGESDFQIAKRLDGDDYNSFQPRLFAEFADDQDKTRVHCYMGVHPFVIAFVVFWFLGVIFCGIVSISQGDDTVTTVDLFGWQYVFRGGWASWVMPLLFLLGGAGIVVGGHYFARGEDKFLVDRVRDILEAQKV